MKKLLLVSTILLLAIIGSASLAAATSGTPDNFNGTSISSFWTQVAPAGGSFSLSTGYLIITAPAGADLGGPNDNAPRLMQQSTVTGDFEITTSVTGTFNSTNYRGGILVWKDSSDFLRLERRGGNTVQMGGKLGSATFQYNIVTLPSDISPTYLKLEKVGSTLTGYWSSDGTTWNTVHSYTLSVSDPIDVGLFALNLGATPFSASFDYFDIIPPGLFSLPEYPLLGTIAVPAAMIGAYVVYKKKPNKKA